MSTLHAKLPIDVAFESTFANSCEFFVRFKFNVKGVSNFIFDLCSFFRPAPSHIPVPNVVNALHSDII